MGSKTKILLFIGSFLIYSSASAQSGAIDNLAKANNEYEAGHFQQCIELLKPIVLQLNTEVRFEAYRLMALSYINQNDNINADKAIVNLLSAKPDYRDFPYFDPVEFTRLLTKYKVWPRFELGVKVGLNSNSINPTKNYSITGSAATFKPGIGYQAGMLVEYFFRDQISVNAELMYEGLNYSRSAPNVSGWQQEFTEKLNYFSIPLSARYYMRKWKELQFGAELGFQIQLLNATNSNIVLNNPSTGEHVENTTQQMSQRNSTLYSGLTGLLLKYTLAGGTLCLNTRFALGLSNVVNSEKRYDNLGFILANQYVDSDINFNLVYFSLGYQFPIPHFYQVKRVGN